MDGAFDNGADPGRRERDLTLFFSCLEAGEGEEVFDDGFEISAVLLDDFEEAFGFFGFGVCNIE